jgi:hypothetical protein
MKLIKIKKNKPRSSLSKWLFYLYVGMFYEKLPTKSIFFMSKTQNPTFCDVKVWRSGSVLVWLPRSGSALRKKLDPDPHWNQWNQCGSETLTVRYKCGKKLRVQMVGPKGQILIRKNYADPTGTGSTTQLMTGWYRTLWALGGGGLNLHLLVHLAGLVPHSESLQPLPQIHKMVQSSVFRES